MTERPLPGKPSPSRMREINDTIRYAMWSVFAVDTRLGVADRDPLAAEVAALLTRVADDGVVVRGTYDLAGMRADADLMIWWHAEDPAALQRAYKAFLRTGLGSHLRPVWSTVALHRPAEFNKSHIPAFLADEEARDYVCVYPFVRSYDWYVLEDADRRDMLREHGQMARDYPDVRANTIAAFALGDYEWILAFEADDLHRIVDLMRELRASRARLHVREETPFFTGPRMPIADLVAAMR
ncbi:MAG: hydrogen peroxide-dependent heme synthase [Dermatophilaceae bacterium]